MSATTQLLSKVIVRIASYNPNSKTWFPLRKEKTSMRSNDQWNVLLRKT